MASAPIPAHSRRGRGFGREGACAVAPGEAPPLPALLASRSRGAAVTGAPGPSDGAEPVSRALGPVRVAVAGAADGPGGRSGEPGRGPEGASVTPVALLPVGARPGRVPCSPELGAGVPDPGDGRPVPTELPREAPPPP